MGLPIKLEGCKLTPTGLQIATDSFATWNYIGESLIALHCGLTWWIGDWYNFGEGKWQQGALLKAAALVNINYSTLANACYLCRAVEYPVRRADLRIAHHEEVAHLSSQEQRQWLELAAREKARHLRLRASIKAWQNAKKSPSALRLLSDEEYNVDKIGTGVISLVALKTKFCLLLNHRPIEQLSVPELRQYHHDLQPFIQTDRRIVARLHEIDENGS
jgi:hypothetical protein